MYEYALDLVAKRTEASHEEQQYNHNLNTMIYELPARVRSTNWRLLAIVINATAAVAHCCLVRASQESAPKRYCANQKVMQQVHVQTYGRQCGYFLVHRPNRMRVETNVGYLCVC